MSGSGMSDPEVERAVISTMLTSAQRAAEVLSAANEGLFSTVLYRACYRSISKTFAEHGYSDPVTVLGCAGDSTVTYESLSEILAHGGSGLALHSHLSLLRDMAEARAIRSKAGVVLQCCEQYDGDIESLRSAVGSLLTYDRRENELHAIADVAEAVVRDLDSGTSRIMRTGLLRLDDRLCGGLRHGGLYSFIGKPKSGKSALTWAVALSVAAQDIPVLWVSLEMSAEECTLRALSSMAGIEITESMERSPYNVEQLGIAKERLKQLPITIIDKPVTVEQIGARAKAMAGTGQCGLLGVDYCQLLKYSDPRARLHEQITHATRTLKSSARELSIPVLLAVQANTKVQHDDKDDKSPPRLRDTKGSSAPVEDSDGALLLSCERETEMSVALAAHRHGPASRTRIGCDFKTMTFYA